MSFSNSFLLRRFEDLASPDDRSIEEVPDPRGSIVLAESDPSELEHVASILRNLNFNVLTAADGETALRLAIEQTPVLVLSSLELPKIDGYKLCKTLRDSKETESIPFMFIVEEGEFPDNLIGHESYAHDYIQKPISVTEFSSRIQSLLKLVASQDSMPGPVLEPQISGEPLIGEATSERPSEALKLCDRLRSLLREVTCCLGDLEVLMSVDSEPENNGRNIIDDEVRILGPRPVDRSSDPADGAKDKREQVEEYLAEYQERVSGVDSLGVVDEVSEGVEDIFSEFFEMELAARSSAAEPIKVSKEMDRPDGSDKPAVAIPSLDAPNVVVASEERKQDGRLYEQAISFVLDSIRGVVSGEAPDIFFGAKLAELIVDSILESSSLIFAATDRGQDYSVSQHSVNVAVFATRVAQTLGRDLQCQREVCLAGLFHELGVGKLPANLIHQEGPLAPEDLRIIQRRPIQSGEIISNLGPEYVWLAEIAGQVTERENGTGNPVGLAGEEIDERAKIIGIADVFDARIHMRPYRESVTGYQALFELTTDQQRAFPDQVVKALIRSFSLYPVNECVRLSTGEVGRVVDINQENLSRPVVTILFDRDGNALIDPTTVDLGRESSLYISEALAVRGCASSQES